MFVQAIRLRPLGCAVTFPPLDKSATRFMDLSSIELLGRRLEGGDSSEVLPQYKRMNIVRTIIGVDGL